MQRRPAAAAGICRHISADVRRAQDVRSICAAPAGHPKEKRICILCISLSFVILCLILPVRLPPHGSGFPLLSFFARFSGSALRSAVHRAESLLRVFRVIAVREELDHTVEIRGGILCISAALVCLGKPKERLSVIKALIHPHHQRQIADSILIASGLQIILSCGEEVITGALEHLFRESVITRLPVRSEQISLYCSEQSLRCLRIVIFPCVMLRLDIEQILIALRPCCRLLSL